MQAWNLLTPQQSDAPMKGNIAAHRTFFQSQATKPVAFRITQLKKLRKLIQENEPLLNAAIYTDFQKSEFDTFTNELALLYQEIDEAVWNLKRWSEKKRVRTDWVNFPAKSYIIPEPLGVCLVIGAWNYPYQLSLAPAIAAIAAGNTVILKPSELPAESSKAMAKMINENFDPGFFKVVEGGVEVTTQLLEQRFDKIFFTGSVPVGRIVYQAAAKHLTPVTLELGGKSPAIILEDANLKMSVKRMVWAKFLNAGQTCIAPDYVLVPRKLQNEFIELLKKEIAKEQFSVANGNYVQIINTKNQKRLEALLDKEKICYGGKSDEATRIFEPTLMKDVSFDDKVMQEEIFGPILPIIPYDNLEEALKKIKEKEKPLSLYIFTSSRKMKNRLLNELSFGGGAVNDAIMHITNSEMPFGGVGESGTGSYHGEHGFRTFSHYKSVIDKPTWLELSLKYFPHTKFKFKLIKFIMRGK